MTAPFDPAAAGREWLETMQGSGLTFAERHESLTALATRAYAAGKQDGVLLATQGCARCQGVGTGQHTCDAYAAGVEAERARVEQVLVVFRSCENHVYERDGCPSCAVASLMVTGELDALRAAGDALAGAVEAYRTAFDGPVEDDYKVTEIYERLMTAARAWRTARGGRGDGLSILR